ncbi:MAG: hypothetical protein M3203_17250, partial [Actinomycetota bacterium]|nr:hypothetical protein [Actinomycetota bacterium]
MAGVIGVIAVFAVASSCSSPTTRRTSPAPTATVESSTTSSSSPASTTTLAPSTTSTSRPATTAPAATPESSAQALYTAWTRGDRAGAERVAEPEAVSALFSRQWQTSDGWSFTECAGAAGSIICTWERPAGQQLLMRVPNPTGGSPIIVSE